MNVQADTLNLAEFLSATYEGGFSKGKTNPPPKPFTLTQVPNTQKPSLTSPSPSSQPKVDFHGNSELNRDSKTPEAEEVEAASQDEESANDAEKLNANLDAEIQPLAPANIEDTGILAAPIEVAPEKELEKPEAEFKSSEEDKESDVKLDQDKKEEAPQAAPVQVKAEFEPESVHLDSEEVVAPASNIRESDIIVRETQAITTRTFEKETKDVDINKESVQVEEHQEEVTAKQEIEINEQLAVKAEAEIKVATQEAATKQEAPAIVTKAPAEQEVSLDKIETKEEASVAATAKISETDAKDSNADLMQEGDAEKQSLEVKQEIQFENKSNEVKSLFAVEVHQAKPSASNIFSSDSAPTPKQMIQQQVADHVKSVISTHNSAKGESVTTINLEPGNLGQISVQIVTKDNNTEIKVLVHDQKTHAMLKEGWDAFVAKELDTVTSSSDASLSFSLNQGNPNPEHAKSMYDFFREMSEPEDQKSLAPSSKSVYDVAGSAASALYDPEAGRVHLTL